MSSTSRASMTVPTPTVSDFLGTCAAESASHHVPSGYGSTCHLLDVVLEKSGAKTVDGEICVAH
jgi:hypothetical protein